jgi:hypothetical protein
MNNFDKQPAEGYTIAIEFANKLPSGASLSTGTVAAVDVQAAATDNSVLSTTTATISGTQARVKVISGTDGKDYKITFTCALSDTSTLEEDVLMRVRAI